MDETDFIPKYKVGDKVINLNGQLWGVGKVTGIVVGKNMQDIVQAFYFVDWKTYSYYMYGEEVLCPAYPNRKDA